MMEKRKINFEKRATEIRRKKRKNEKEKKQIKLKLKVWKTNGNT